MDQSTFNQILGNNTSKITFQDVEISQKILQQYGYQTLQIIGIGSFGIVMKAINLRNEEVAIKMISCNNNQEIVNCFNEASLMRKGASPNLAKLEEFFFDLESKQVFIVQKYYKGGNLDSYIKKNKNVSQKQIKDIFVGILNGVQALHDKNIIHSDLKPENILMSENGIPFVTDLGLSNIIKESNLDATMFGGNAMYSPPEITEKKRISFYSDYFSLGMLLYFLCEKIDFYKVSQIMDGIQPDFTNRKNETLLKLALTMMCIVPQERQNIKCMIQIMNTQVIPIESSLSYPQNFLKLAEHQPQKIENKILNLQFAPSIKFNLSFKMKFELNNKNNEVIITKTGDDQQQCYLNSKLSKDVNYLIELCYYHLHDNIAYFACGLVTQNNKDMNELHTDDIYFEQDDGGNSNKILKGKSFNSNYENATGEHKYDIHLNIKQKIFRVCSPGYKNIQELDDQNYFKEKEIYYFAIWMINQKDSVIVKSIQEVKAFPNIK